MSDPTASPYSSVAGYPDQVINPAPFDVTITVNNTTHVTTLSWAAVTGALYYDIYYGIEQSRLLLFQPELQATTYVVPSAAIALNTAYYIQVVAFLGPRLSVGSIVQQFAVPYSLLGVTGSILYGTTGNVLYGAS